MKLLIIRHGDPDYANDTLTEQGRREAELLSLRMEKENVKQIYVSPMGRARDTASYTLKKKGMEGIVCPWLQEFPVRIQRPDLPEGEKSVVWDWLPADWTKEDAFYDASAWSQVPIMRDAGVPEEYAYVTGEFDKLLASLGYEREGRLYRAVRPNEDTYAFFCHFGLECVLLSHLMNVSPMPLWHGLCAPPTSVTTIYTDERRQGIAFFRANAFGDTSHLYVSGEEPGFSARFSQTYTSLPPHKRLD